MDDNPGLGAEFLHERAGVKRAGGQRRSVPVVWLPIREVARSGRGWAGAGAALRIDALGAAAFEIGVVGYGEVAAAGAQKPSGLGPPHHGFESSALGAVGAADDIVHCESDSVPERTGCEMYLAILLYHTFTTFKLKQLPGNFPLLPPPRL